MIGQRTASALRILHWTTGLVVLLESYRTFHAALPRLHDAGHAGGLTWVRLVLSGCEMIAALLFLVPVATLVGGYLLMAIFALAITVHTLHGDLGGLEILVLYGVAVLVVLACKKDTMAESRSS